jgi:DNA-binding MarR family transcriptional regulator
MSGATLRPANMTTLQRQDYDALAAFRYGLRKFLRFSKKLLHTSVDLTPEQYEALLALKTCPSDEGLLVGQVSERLQVKPHTAVALTDKLVARGLVTKERAEQDRRQVYVKLTPSGQTLLEALAAVHRDEIRRHAPEMIEALRHLQKE